MNTKYMRAATWLALTTAVISGTANFVNKIAVTATPDAVVYTTLKNSLVAIFLLGIMIAASRMKEVLKLTRKQMLLLVAVGAVGGSLPFALYFTGLTMTSALNASLIHKTLFLWVVLFAIPLLRERLSRQQVAGVAAIFLANILIGGFQGFRFNAGELMILAATILWAGEQMIAKVALRGLSPLLVASARMMVGSLILLPFALSRGGGQMLDSVTPGAWIWALASAVLLCGYVLTWYAALKRAPAIYVATLLVPATLITNALSAVFVTHSFQPLQVTSAALFIAGSYLMIKFTRSLAPSSPIAGSTPAIQSGAR